VDDVRWRGQWRKIALKRPESSIGHFGVIDFRAQRHVRPFSCSPYIPSIHQGIDSREPTAITHIARPSKCRKERIKNHSTDTLAHYEMWTLSALFESHIKKGLNKWFSSVKETHSITKPSDCGGVRKISNGAR